MTTDLLTSAIRGDQTAIMQLLYSQRERLLKLLATKIPASLQSLLDPEDILLQAFAEATRSIASFQPQAEHSFDAWLQRIVHNQLQDEIKAHKTLKRGGDLQRVDPHGLAAQNSSANLFEALVKDLPTPSRVVALKEGVGLMLVNLAALPADYRQVIELRDLQGLSREETARALGKTLDQVRNLHHSAKQALRAAMGELSHYLSMK